MNGQCGQVIDFADHLPGGKRWSRPPLSRVAVEREILRRMIDAENTARTAESLRQAYETMVVGLIYEEIRKADAKQNDAARLERDVWRILATNLLEKQQKTKPRGLFARLRRALDGSD